MIRQLSKPFTMMYDNFPEPVMLTHKNREMIAVNRRAKELGLQVGVKCSSYGRPEQHKGCLCNQAVESKKPVYLAFEGPFGRAYGFWLRVPDNPEWIIHFGVGQSMDYDRNLKVKQ